MITQINKIACLGAICFATNAMAEFKGVWMAGASENKVITNYDVGVYTKNYVISDKVKMSLFKSTNGNYELYQEQLDELAEKLYEDTLNRMLYQRYIESFANFSQKRGERNYFKTTSRDYRETVEREIKKHLEKFRGEANPQQAYGQFLQSSGYPHQTSESALDTYNKWEEELRYKVKEDFRVKNVNIAEYGIALENYPDRYRNPENDIMAVSNYQDKHRKGWSRIAGKTLARSEYDRFSKDLDPMVVDAKVYGLESSIGEIRKSNGFLADSAKFISTSFNKEILITPIEKVDEYVELAQELSQTKTREDLESSRQAELKKFMGGAKRASLVIARLYDLALELQGREAHSLADKKTEILGFLRDASKIDQTLRSAPDDAYIAEAIGEALASTKTTEEALLIEIVKNSIEEITKRSQVRVEVNLRKSLSMQEYDRVKARVRSEFQAKVLAHFRRGHVYRHAYHLRRAADGRRHERGEEVLSKIIP